MSEEELQQKENELNEREAKLNERENALNEREADLESHKNDTENLIKQVKEEYEAKMLKQHDAYEARLKEREKVIKQLLSGDSDANKTETNIIIDKINARRIAQAKKW